MQGVRLTCCTVSEQQKKIFSKSQRKIFWKSICSRSFLCRLVHFRGCKHHRYRRLVWDHLSKQCRRFSFVRLLRTWDFWYRLPYEKDGENPELLIYKKRSYKQKENSWQINDRLLLSKRKWSFIYFRENINCGTASVCQRWLRDCLRQPDSRRTWYDKRGIVPS